MYKNGAYYIGWYKNVERHGYGKYVYAFDGKIEEGLFEDDVFKPLGDVKYDKKLYYA